MAKTDKYAFLMLFILVLIVGTAIYGITQIKTNYEDLQNAETDYIYNSSSNMTGKDKVILATEICNKYFSNELDYNTCMRTLLDLK